MPAEKNIEPEKKIYTVTQINDFLKKYIAREPFFGNFWVKGEVSSLKYHTSGHIYFSLKDSRSQARAMIFKSVAGKLNFKLSDGLEVFCRCKLDIYTEGGSYSLVVQELQSTGEGELYRKFLEIKERLKQEGLFEPEHKKPIPSFCREIGVITSRTGAVIRDILRVIQRRAPWVKVSLFPAVVQGPDAAPDLIRALKLARSLPTIDAIIIGRGGGSMEDLWCFNDETLVREIFNTEIPIISAVGHEIDWTIVDFVSDRRAATPTEAAEICTPDRATLIKNLNRGIERAERALTGRLNYYEEVLENVKTSRYFAKPGLLIQDRADAVDKTAGRLHYTVTTICVRHRQQVNNYIKVLQAYSPQRLLAAGRQNLERTLMRLQRAYPALLDVNNQKLEQVYQAVRLLGPGNILKRGYALVEKAGKKIVRSVDAVAVGDEITVRLADGTLLSTVRQKNKE